jgi:hypothetical protein
MSNVISTWSINHDEMVGQEKFGEVFDAIIYDADYEDILPEWKSFIMMEELKDLEKRFSQVYSQGYEYDELWNEDFNASVPRNFKFPIHYKKEKPIKKWAPIKARNNARCRPMGIKA